MTIVSHLVVCITILLSRDSNVLACLPFEYTDEQYARKDIELAAGLSVAIGLLCIELVGR